MASCKAVGVRARLVAVSAVGLAGVAGRVAAGPPTITKQEWVFPGHGYRLVAVHGAQQGNMGPGHLDVTVAQPNAVWTNQITLATSNTPAGAPMTLTALDRVTHLLAGHAGEAFPVGPYLVFGGVIQPPPSGNGSRGRILGTFQFHAPHRDISIGAVRANWVTLDSIDLVRWAESGIHDPPPGCTGRAALSDGGQLVPPVVTGALGMVTTTLHLGPNELTVSLEGEGFQPSQVVSTELRVGAPGDNGPVILSALGPWTAVTTQVSSAAFMATLPAANTQDYLTGRVYVQVNTTAFPQGVMRGQLVAPTLYSNSGNLDDPFMVTRAGGQCAVNGDATDMQTALGLGIFGYGCSAATSDAMADDFIVPAGQQWFIEGVELYLYQPNASSTTITSVDLAFSDTDLLGQPQPAWTTVPVTPWMTRTFRKADTDAASAGCTRRLQAVFVPLQNEFIVGPGRHWVTWRATGTSGFGGPFQMAVVAPGQAHAPGANGMASPGGGAYVAVGDGSPSQPQDLVFRLAGFAQGVAAPACYANCDGSATVPVLNVADFTCFLQKYALGDPYANCDGSTAPPAINVGDFTCFLQAYAGGCP